MVDMVDGVPLSGGRLATANERCQIGRGVQRRRCTCRHGTGTSKRELSPVRDGEHVAAYIEKRREFHHTSRRAAFCPTSTCWLWRKPPRVLKLYQSWTPPHARFVLLYTSVRIRATVQVSTGRLICTKEVSCLRSCEEWGPEPLGDVWLGALNYLPLCPSVNYYFSRGFFPSPHLRSCMIGLQRFLHERESRELRFNWQSFPAAQDPRVTGAAGADAAAGTGGKFVPLAWA